MLGRTDGSVQDVRATEKDRVKIYSSFRPGDIVRAEVVDISLDCVDVDIIRRPAVVLSEYCEERTRRVVCNESGYHEGKFHN